MKKFDKSKVQKHSDKEIKNLNQFCKDNGIAHTTREFYFTLGATNYRLSSFGPTSSNTISRSKPLHVPTHKRYIDIRASKWDLKKIYLALKAGEHPKGFEDIPLPKEEIQIERPREDDLFNAEGYVPEPVEIKVVSKEPTESELRKKKYSLKEDGKKIEVLSAYDIALIELAVEEKEKPTVKKVDKSLPVAEPQEEKKPVPVIQPVKKRPTKQDVLNSLLKKKR